MSDEKKVYNSISEFKDPDVGRADNVKSEDLQIISDLDLIAPKEEHDDKMKMDDTAFWSDINSQLDESIMETDRLLRESLEEKELELAAEEDEKILNGESESEDLDIESEYNEESFDEEEYTPKKIYNKHSTVTEETGLFDDDIDEFSDKDIEEDIPEDDEEGKEFIKNIQSSIKDQIKPINNPIDISGFSFSKR